VVTLHQGRINADDLTTLKLVLDAANQITQDNYSIVINQVSRRFWREGKPKELVANLVRALKDRVPTTENVHFIKEYDDDHLEMDNQLVHLDDDTRCFLTDMPTFTIEPEKVQDVNSDEFDVLAAQLDDVSQKMNEAVKEKDVALKEKADALEKERLALEKKAAAEKKERLALEKKAAAEEKERKAEKAKVDAEKAKVDAEEAKVAAEKAKTDAEKDKADAEKRAKQIGAGAQELIRHMREADWVHNNAIAGYSPQTIIARIRELTPEQQADAYRVVLAKSNYTVENIVTVGIFSSKINAFRVEKEDGEVICEDGNGAWDWESGSWIYSMDKNGSHKSWTA
jgi:hypothetical protein